jgi:hypothetical protein
VFTGVISFLYSIAFIIIYVFFRHKYQNMVFFPIAVSFKTYCSVYIIKHFDFILKDFIITLLITLFWFAGSIAWSKAVDDLKNKTDTATLFRLFSTCTQVSCKSVPPSPTYASIVISCVRKILFVYLLM